MCNKKTYCVGEPYHNGTIEWLSPHVKKFKGDKYGATQITLNSGEVANKNDYIIYENGYISVISFDEAQAYAQKCRCITCEYAVASRHPNPTSENPVCLAGGHPQHGWQSICCVLLNGPENQYDLAYEPRSTTLSHIEDMAEWDADYYARQILGKTNEEIDAAGDEDCIHAWVTKDLLQKQRTALIPHEQALTELAKTAVTRFSDIGRAMHASNINAEIDQMQTSLASILGAHGEE